VLKDTLFASWRSREAAPELAHTGGQGQQLRLPAGITGSSPGPGSSAPATSSSNPSNEQWATVSDGTAAGSDSGSQRAHTQPGAAPALGTASAGPVPGEAAVNAGADVGRDQTPQEHPVLAPPASGGWCEESYVDTLRFTSVVDMFVPYLPLQRKHVRARALPMVVHG
jgi:hypothetical protein